MKSFDDLVDGLRGLGLRSSPEALRAFLDHATKSRASPAQTCELLVDLERRERERRNLARRQKNAALGSFSPLDRFDWAHPRTIDRGLFDQLASLDFLRRGENVLLRGQSGVGKTTLAQNLGLLALQSGYTVRFATLAAAIADLLRQESLPALERRFRRYTRPDLLILDEIGYLPCDARSADLFFNIVSRRHEKRSVVITTNLPFKDWSSIFPGAACVVALVDRFVQHCHVLDIDADSWRQKHARTEPQSPKPPTSKKTRR